MKMKPLSVKRKKKKEVTKVVAIPETVWQSQICVKNWVQIKISGPKLTKQRLSFQKNLAHSSVPLLDVPGLTEDLFLE